MTGGDHPDVRIGAAFVTVTLANGATYHVRQEGSGIVCGPDGFPVDLELMVALLEIKLWKFCCQSIATRVC